MCSGKSLFLPTFVKIDYFRPQSNNFPRGKKVNKHSSHARLKISFLPRKKVVSCSPRANCPSLIGVRMLSVPSSRGAACLTNSLHHSSLGPRWRLQHAPCASNTGSCIFPRSRDKFISSAARAPSHNYNTSYQPYKSQSPPPSSPYINRPWFSLLPLAAHTPVPSSVRIILIGWFVTLELFVTVRPR